MISMSYSKLAVDVKPGSTILCSDGTITLTALSCDTEKGLVRCRCENSALLGERKNVNLPGVIVDLPTLTEKDKVDILQWGVPNKIDMIALSFVRKGSDQTFRWSGVCLVNMRSRSYLCPRFVYLHKLAFLSLGCVAVFLCYLSLTCRLRIKKALPILMTYLQIQMLSWLLVVIWGWRSRLRRYSTLRR
jgi:hypothetical protein